MAIQRVSSGGRYESAVGYCRAVVAGGFVYVSGTTAQGDDLPADAAEQCRLALDAIGGALASVGAGFADVVRVRYILADRREFEACWPILAATFGDDPPAATMIEAGLIDPRYRIEIEVTALAPTHR